MDNVTTTRQDLSDKGVAEVEITEDASNAEAPTELHLPATDGEVDIVRTTQKVRWMMQRC